jgi:hypothetical protein
MARSFSHSAESEGRPDAVWRRYVDVPTASTDWPDSLRRIK